MIGGVLRYGIPSFRLPRDDRPRVKPPSRSGEVRDEQGHQQERSRSAAPDGDGLRRRVHWNRRGRAELPRHPGRVRGRRVQRERVPHAREPHGRRPLPVRGHARHAGRRVVVSAPATPRWTARASRRLSGHGRQMRLPPPHGGGGSPRASRRSATRRRRGSPSTGCRSPLKIETDEAGDVKSITCQVMELGPPDKSGRRPFRWQGETETFLCDTVIYARHEGGSPVIARSTLRPRHPRGGLHQRRPEDAGGEPAGRLRGRRHRDGAPRSSSRSAPPPRGVRAIGSTSRRRSGPSSSARRPHRRRRRRRRRRTP